MSKPPRRNIKSLSALFAFEAAGRHRNFTVAAQELGVTQAAVSKQVALLEADLGRPLFQRLHREVRLTTAGKALFDVATTALGKLSDTLADLRDVDQRRPLTIGATLAMSHFWLLPRLPGFRALHPDVQIRVVSQDEPLGLADGSIDMVVRFGDGQWRDGKVFPLFKSAIVAMASPGFLAGRPALSSIDEVIASPLIEYDAPDPTWASWSDWLAATGTLSSPPRPALSFSRYSDAIQAAVGDQGIILVWSGLSGGLEEHGGLVRVPGPALTPNGDFFLVADDTGPATVERSAFVAWLLAEAA